VVAQDETALQMRNRTTPTHRDVIVIGRHLTYGYLPMTRRFIHRVAVVSIALSLALGLLPRLALCVGPDGHHALESMNAACCNRVTHSAGPDAQAPHDGCAAGCIDTPLTVSLALDRDRTHSVTAPPSAVAAALTFVFAHQITGQFVRPASGVPFHSPPRVLRTTVHLC